MASASTAQDGENPKRGKLSPQDEDIMQKPFAAAVSFMGFSPYLIVRAVKALQAEHRDIEVGRLLAAVEELAEAEKSGRPLPSLDSSKEDVPEGERGSMEGEGTVAGQTVYTDDDIETDGALSALPEGPPLVRVGVPAGVRVGGPGGLQAGVPAAGGNRIRVGNRADDGAGQDRASLLRKLKALQQENRLLKAQQLCRGCHHRPVSITFLPCGHYSYCHDCGQNCSACPICQKTILADVRTFLA